MVEEEEEEKVEPEPLPPPAPVAPVAQVSHEEAGVEAAACVSEQRLQAAVPVAQQEETREPVPHTQKKTGCSRRRLGVET